MNTTTRRSVLAGAAGLLASPAIIGRAAAATRGVSDTEIIIGMMTDLSGVTAVQGSNAANSIRMAFDEINEKGGINGRKIRFIVEDMEYLVPKAVQAMNKLVNRDNIFLVDQQRRHAADGRGPADDAREGRAERVSADLRAVDVRAAQQVQIRPVLVVLRSDARLREVFRRDEGQEGHRLDVSGHRLRQGHPRRRRGPGGGDEAEAGRRVGVRPTDTDFNAQVTRLKEAGCDLVCMGTIVTDTIIILQTAHKMGWDVDFCGQFATYSTAVAEAPGEPAEGFYSMSPGLYAYPDDPRPAVREVTARYKQRFGIDINYLGEAGYAAAACLIDVLQRAGRDLNLDTFQKSMESIKDWRDIFGGPPLTITPTDHHASNQSFLSVVKKTRWTPVVAEPLGY